MTTEPKFPGDADLAAGQPFEFQAEQMPGLVHAAGDRQVGGTDVAAIRAFFEAEGVRTSQDPPAEGPSDGDAKP